MLSRRLAGWPVLAYGRLRCEDRLHNPLLREERIVSREDL